MLHVQQLDVREFDVEIHLYFGNFDLEAKDTHAHTTFEPRKERERERRRNIKKIPVRHVEKKTIKKE